MELWVKYMQIRLIRTGFSSFPSQKSRVLYPQGFLAKNHTKDSQVNVYNSLLLTGLDCANLASVDEYLFTVVTEVFVRLFCGWFFFSSIETGKPIFLDNFLLIWIKTVQSSQKPYFSYTEIQACIFPLFMSFMLGMSLMSFQPPAIG